MSQLGTSNGWEQLRVGELESWENTFSKVQQVLLDVGWCLPRPLHMDSSCGLHFISAWWLGGSRPLILKTQLTSVPLSKADAVPHCPGSITCHHSGYKRIEAALGSQ